MSTQSRPGTAGEIDRGGGKRQSQGSGLNSTPLKARSRARTFSVVADIPETIIVGEAGAHENDFAAALKVGPIGGKGDDLVEVSLS